MAEEEKKAEEKKEIQYVQEDPGPIGRDLAERQIEVTQLVARRTRTASLLIGFATVFITLAIGGASLYQAIIDSRNAQQAREADRELALDQQREAALQAYFDKTAALLLEENLRNSAPQAEERSIARSRTLTTLRGLDPNRKGALLQFLFESELIDAGDVVISLSGANLSRADLGGANLRGADLSGADLRRANLFGAILSEANLRGADLGEAILLWANLGEANLSEANLSRADLSRAILSEANLFGANLSGADLGEANLRGADLGEAILGGADLEGAKHDDSTQWPAGFDLERLK